MTTLLAALFVLRDSVYKSIPGVDCYDEDRDARTYIGNYPVIAHPPCRSWGRFKHFSKGNMEDKALAPWAVETVRRCGGVLEHPAYSSLWKYCGLPAPGFGYDAFGGWTLSVDQFWFGHKAQKRTWLYIVGCHPMQIPAYSINLSAITHVVDTRSRANRHKAYITHRERHATPEPFARWLVALARRCNSD